jgi:hypothetical protein
MKTQDGFTFVSLMRLAVRELFTKNRILHYNVYVSQWWAEPQGLPFSDHR